MYKKKTDIDFFCQNCELIMVLEGNIAKNYLGHIHNKDTHSILLKILL